MSTSALGPTLFVLASCQHGMTEVPSEGLSTVDEVTPERPAEAVRLVLGIEWFRQ